MVAREERRMYYFVRSRYIAPTPPEDQADCLFGEVVREGTRIRHYLIARRGGMTWHFALHFGRRPRPRRAHERDELTPRPKRD